MNENNYSTASDPEIALGVECALPWIASPSLARVNPMLLRAITGRRTISRDSSGNPSAGAAIRSIFIPKLV